MITSSSWVWTCHPWLSSCSVLTDCIRSRESLCQPRVSNPSLCLRRPYQVELLLVIIHDADCCCCSCHQVVKEQNQGEQKKQREIHNKKSYTRESPNSPEDSKKPVVQHSTFNPPFLKPAVVKGRKPAVPQLQHSCSDTSRVS